MVLTMRRAKNILQTRTLHLMSIFISEVITATTRQAGEDQQLRSLEDKSGVFTFLFTIFASAHNT